jgi:hypothetical protein
MNSIFLNHCRVNVYSFYIEFFYSVLLALQTGGKGDCLVRVNGISARTLIDLLWHIINCVI